MSQPIQIIILGPGCANCHRLEFLARSVTEEGDLDVEIKKETDPVQFINYGVLTTPGMVINGKTVSSGRVPSKSEIADFISEAIGAQS